MKIEVWKLSDITPYDKNPRINDEAVDAVAGSIQEFGFQQPIVDDVNDVILAGHTRYKATMKLGLEKVPVHVAKGLTPAQAKAYRLADNKTAELAEWNEELLPLELADLKALDFDLELLGFGEDELARLLDPDVKEGLTDPDDVPEPPDDPITQPGDLWMLGKDRVLCGDSRKPADVARWRRHPSREHGSALQRQSRATQQQRNRGRQQLIHEQAPSEIGPGSSSREIEADT